MEGTTEHVTTILAKLPDAPGVYFMKNKKGKTIYIGKAKSLKKRVSSYFSKSGKDVKTLYLVEDICDIDVIVTKNEVEAIILEAELIKKHRPFYNIELKDNKTYPFIKITDEPFPRIYKTRTVTKEGRYFGPFVNAGHVMDILRMVEKLFPLRTCRKQITKPKKHSKCLNYHINKCKAPCEGLITKKAYATYIEQAARFLSGDVEGLQADLREEMARAAAGEKFEKAKELRDQIDLLATFFVAQDVYCRTEGDKDVIGIHGEEGRYTLILLAVRQGKLIDKKSFTLKGVGEKGDIVNEFLKQYYYNSMLAASEIIIGEVIEDNLAIEAWLRERAGHPVTITLAGEDGRDEGLLRIAYENARLTFRETSAERETTPGLVRLQEIFKMDAPPLIIEGFDIAHLHGKYTVAAMVRFTNGRSDTKEYRTFNIKSVPHIDDPASIHEAVLRRYRRLRDENAPLPDIILIDGGPTQLRAATDALTELSLKGLRVISLAKRFEEIYFPNRTLPLRLERHDEALRLLQRVRDEAHRFGNSRHIQKRKEDIASELTQVKGVGEELRKRILETFGGISGVKNADEDALAGVKGVSLAVARRIKAHFTSHENIASETHVREEHD